MTDLHCNTVKKIMRQHQVKDKISWSRNYNNKNNIHFLRGLVVDMVAEFIKFKYEMGRWVWRGRKTSSIRH